MSFESRIIAFADRFLSDRTVQLIVEPALADLQFERGTGPLSRAANRLAVLRAVAGGVRDDVTRGSGGFIALTLMPTCYYLFLMVICFDFRPSVDRLLRRGRIGDPGAVARSRDGLLLAGTAHRARPSTEAAPCSTCARIGCRSISPACAS